MMNVIERLRYEVVHEMLKLGTMQKVWPSWRPQVESVLGTAATVSAHELIQLGDNLHGIFTSTSTRERGQSDVSAGGTAWEVLVCWYLNLCLLGSNTVVIKAKKAHIPTPISDSITVMYGNTPSNSESDLLAITFPSFDDIGEEFTGSVNELKNKLNEIVESAFHETELVIIQCKTNWNDNAQIPMLWDLIYSSKGFNTSASVGVNGYTISRLKRFAYAFVTVPTVNPDKINPSSVCVTRVSSLSGGNFWGLPNKAGVASNISNMLGKNFQTGLNGYNLGWRSDIGDIIRSVLASNNYFDVL